MNPKPREANKPKKSFDSDTYDCSFTWEAAKISAGSALNLLKALVNNEIDVGFGLIRPPGHHAIPEAS